VGHTAYVVGGFDGAKASDRILAWRPGGRVRTVARLPHALRYAAVATLGQTLYVAGGTSERGNATRDLLAFDTRGGTVTKVGRLPRATTHAAAAAFGCCVYVIGGRGTNVGTPTRRIYAFDPSHKHLQSAGRLPQPLSDLGAVAQRRRILVFGGRGSNATAGSVVQLAPPS
jgi:N-acetylneuraminic acid mutarotase